MRMTVDSTDESNGDSPVPTPEKVDHQIINESVDGWEFNQLLFGTEN